MPLTKTEVENALNLKWFGAKWDGVTDDSKALEEAMTASREAGGVPILLPPGTGVINSIPKIPKNLQEVPCQITIRGAGMRNTIVKMPEALTFLTFANTSHGDTVGNIDLSDFTVDGNKQQVKESKAVPVIIGTTASCFEQVNIENVRIRRVRSINVPALDKEEQGRSHVILTVYHKEPGLTLNRIEGIDIRECEFEGGQCGILIEGSKGSAPVPLNIRISHVYIGDCAHVIGAVPTEKEGFNAHVQIGQFAYSDGKSIVLERIFGENSGDVGIEMDVPGTLRDCWMVNDNNTGYLFNTFNCATINEPVVTKTTATVEAGKSIAKVTSTAGFAVGGRVVFFGAKVGKCEVRTIKALSEEGKSIEFTEALGLEWATGTWLQQVDDMSAVKWAVSNIYYTRTHSLPGSNHGVQVQNAENALPAPEVDIDGFTCVKTAADCQVGEVVSAQCGTSTSPTGNPAALRIRRLKADLKNTENETSETRNFWPLYLVMRGAACPIEIEGEITTEGPGVTSTGKLPGMVVRLQNTSGIIDLDLLTQWTIKNTGGEAWRGLCVNQESSVGDISGRIRHRTRQSVITEGGVTHGGVRLGKACGFASQEAFTTLKGALASKSTTIPVNSTEGFAVGMAIVIDALSSTKSEVFVISSIKSGESLTVVSVGNTPGTAVEHAEGAVVATLRTLVIEDCDWTGLGSSGTGIAAEDENVYIRALTRGNTPSSPPTPQKITLPESAKAFQIVQKGQGGTLAVEGGTVTAVEWSADGKNFFKLAAATNVTFHVNTGDFVKITWTAEPSVNFVADRV